MRRAAPVLFFFLFACASSIELREVQDVDTLYFGTARPSGAVADADWRAFTHEVIEPEFPGYTEWNATGHWHGAEEPTHVVQIAHLSRPGNDRRIIRIVDEYKRRFQQESVLWVRQRGLVAPQ